MKRVLLHQMLHDWKSNSWFVFELAIVAFCIWVITTYMWFMCEGMFLPRGFTPENVYSIEVKSINPQSPYYIDEYKDNYYADRNELIRRLRQNPNVEYVSLHNNFVPYTYNFQGNIFNIEGYPDSIGYYGNCRTGEPEIIKLLDIRSATGKTQDELVAMLQRGEILISATERNNENLGSVKDLIGKKAYYYEHEDEAWRIGDVVLDVRRNDYEPPMGGTVIMPFRNLDEWGNIVLKVKDGRDKEFEKDFGSDRSLTHLRNVYLSNLESVVKRGQKVHREFENHIHIFVGICVFLLITISLGLLGSFWFRVQQRVGEIAIRKTFGATNADLFRRIISEGMFLLAAAVIISSAFVWPFIKKVTESTGQHWTVFLVSQFVTIAIMGLCILLSLWYPSWRAMKIEPAIAIKEE